MAVPKRKVSAARRDKRRTAKERLDVPGMVACPKCGEMIYLDDDLLECDDILCPECGEKLICELDECDGCSCCDKED